jgi:hypothetical protein
MGTQIRLEMDTGNGNTALAADCGTINPLYQPLFDIAFDNQPIGSYHGQRATDIVKFVNRAVESLMLDRDAYRGLTAVEKGYRSAVLTFCVAWRDKLREHPEAKLYLVP